MQVLRTASLLVLLSMLCSCAAMFTGTRSNVSFTSDPTGAEVLVGDMSGTTPCNLSINKGVDEVVFSHPEVGSQGGEIDSGFRWGFLVMDILFTPGWGVSGMLVDGLTGAWWSPPDRVHCDFRNPGSSTGFVVMQRFNTAAGKDEVAIESP